MAEVLRDPPLLIAQPRRPISAVVWAVLAVAGLSAGWLLRGRAEGGAAPAERVGTLLHLEPFVINLADPEQRAYLRVGVDLELGNGAFKEEARAAISARVRDTILEVLTQRGADELVTAEGKTRLKRELAHALQQRDPELQVHEVYFTEFLVQR